MTTQLQIILILLLLILGFFMFLQLKKRRLELQYCITWIFMLWILLMIAIFPGILEWTADAVGFELPGNMLFFVGIVVVLIIIFRLTQVISQMSYEIKRLAQRVALDEKKEDRNDRA